MAVCCERAEFYVNDRIRGRDAQLKVVAGEIKEKTNQEEIDPGFKLRHLMSQNEAYGASDIFRTFGIQKVIHREIKRLEKSNKEKHVLMNRIKHHCI